MILSITPTVAWLGTWCILEVHDAAPLGGSISPDAAASSCQSKFTADVFKQPLLDCVGQLQCGLC